MRLKLVLIIAILSSYLSVEAQVGIKTENPLGVFHIDPLENTSVGGASGTSDDVIVLNNGRVGLGISPTANLHVNGGFRLVDGTEGANKMLVSDANGGASWQYKTLGQRVGPISLAPMLSNHDIVGSTFRYTGASITLPPGNWQVNLNATYLNENTTSVALWWDLCPSATTHSYFGRALSYTAPPSSHAPVSAVYFVSHTVTTTYYLWVRAQYTLAVPMKYTGEGRMWAMQIQ
ncbi:hypothetical protein [Dysgonomonas sp. 520]|uniref:hypothetical protein n=1 Tax=Dysgonomonas sp. 520 TaxID=2302931 RepID=UPI0013D43090|nr:hypothetical protein [Dysgonomonas sp. 520]NDW09610.1 hypothetical protein [Dysgonomonas sp. 520]